MSYLTVKAGGPTRHQICVWRLVDWGGGGEGEGEEEIGGGEEGGGGRRGGWVGLANSSPKITPNPPS